MPIYEYRCDDCGHVFEEFMRWGEEQEPVCPQCGSKEASKAFSLFGTTGTTSGSARSSNAEAACAPSG